jgi:uncharacterized protein (DUF885 family)
MIRTCLAMLLALAASAGGGTQAPATSVQQLADEFSARSGPGFWGDTSGTLVRDRLPLLLESQSRQDARWAGDLLKRLEAIPATSLSHEEWLTWSLLRWEAELGSRRHDFFWLDVPIAPYSSPLRTITSGFAAARLTTVDERRRYLDGLHLLPVLAAQIEAKLRGQAVRNIVLPLPQIVAVAPFVRSFAAIETSPFAVSAPRLDAVPADERDGFAAAVRDSISLAVAPAFTRLADYIEGAYKARAPGEVGLGRYPGGDAYYRFLVRQHTGLELSPQQIHEIGLQEVARLEGELDAARRDAGFKGSLAEFRHYLKTDRRFFPSDPQQIGDRLMAAAAKIEPKLPEMFATRPKAAYGARRLAPALEPVMTYGYYQIPTASEPTGHYLFNGSKLEERSLLFVAALSYHELVPGHHFQMALTLENDRLPAFRRNAMYTSFTEGWGEYASDLAGELGMYADPYDRAGRISMDLFLSTRLVVDTGMNALGWSRERAMAFMRDHTFESETQIASETLRYSTDMPGQALAYKMGSREIRQLRDRYRSRAAGPFDIRRFHQAVLGHGSMPLPILEQHLARTFAAPAR